MKIEDLVPTARTKGKSYASNKKWSAVRDDHGRVIVYHYKTAMLWVLPDGTPQPISRGRGSTSDVQGVRKVLAGIGINMSYKDFYNKEQPS